MTRTETASESDRASLVPAEDCLSLEKRVHEGPALTTATFTGMPQADATNAGRYTMSNSNSPKNPLAASINGGNGVFNLVICQASSGQLFWLEVDNNGVFAGTLAQQGSLTGLPIQPKIPITPQVPQ